MADPLRQLLLGPGWALLAPLLPCPLDAGWINRLDQALPPDAGRGGYSAVHYDRPRHRLWLLSDLPGGELSAWTLPTRGSAPRRLEALQLQVPEPVTRQLDGEGLVLSGDQAWVASEGRRSGDREAQLLRFSRASGALLQAVPLPAAWRVGPDQGLESNAGPESLAQLNRPGQALALLMAAERPLRQDPPGQVRLLRWHWPQGLDPSLDPPQAEEQGALRAPADGDWGLTDLLVLHPANPGQPLLLSLWRRYREPLQWSNQLRLYPLPARGQVADALQHWDLQGIGLTPENWEGLSLGPLLSSGQPSLLLVSDDNLNPLQTSRLALLQPRRTSSCGPQQP